MFTSNSITRVQGLNLTLCLHMLGRKWEKISSDFFVVQQEMEIKEYTNIATCEGILIGNLFVKEFKSNLSSQQ